MKILWFFILLLIISCQKENVYYYSDNRPIKDSTVIRFVEREMQTLKIDSKEKNLKIFTTLDSISYKNNLDSIRAKILEKALSYNLKQEDKKAFNDWFREKIIVVDNKTGKTIHFYSSFKNAKFDRYDANIGSLRKFIRLGTFLAENSASEIPQNYLFNYGYQTVSSNSLTINEKEAKFLSQFNLKNLKKEGYFYNNISFLKAAEIFQTLNSGTLREPFVINKILDKNKPVYIQHSGSRKIFSEESAEKIKKHLQYYKEHSFGIFKNELKDTQSLILFGTNLDQCLILDDGKFTYLIYNFRGIVTDIQKKKVKEIPFQWVKKSGILYYNAIRK
ncbi:hypothetical protein [Chryseobacterium gambrini]|uniref:hypothetical protein n=1 Tax=Chryseobacterium gambrini TaxID=373672 RepID=UPI0022F3F90B|nr:hypothetical protein [Chryseobacterium gambrini]WBX99318.1 hypothetical protein PE065_08720 [Chryseobacterium gambrini]